jgi:hypothetical protein
MSQDHFADMRGFLNSQGFGALGGDGAEAHHGFKSSVTPEGVQFQVACDNCGIPNGITPTWSELVYGMCGMEAPGWKFSQRYGGFHPNAGCRSCNALIMLIFTPQECARHLKAGEAARYVTAQQVGQLAQRLRGG